jgi:hypothetical protein
VELEVVALVALLNWSDPYLLSDSEPNDVFEYLF